jgi:hypothetical protein
VSSVRVEHVVVVDVRQTLVRDLDQAAGAVDPKPPEPPVPVEKQRVTVRRPVRRFDQQLVGLEDQLGGGTVRTADPDL